jgi:hypothetical protein
LDDGWTNVKACPALMRQAARARFEILAMLICVLNWWCDGGDSCSQLPLCVVMVLLINCASLAGCLRM